MTREIELIGGPANGKRIVVDGHPLHVRMPVMEHPACFVLSMSTLGEAFKPLPIKTAIYRAMTEDAGCCRYEFIGIDGEGEKIKAQNIVDMFERLQGPRDPLRKTPREMVLARMHNEFDQALSDTEWSRDEQLNRLLLSCKRYRVVRIIHKRGRLEIDAIYINKGPYTFEEAQRLVDWFTKAYANGELHRSRNYMQEISP